MQHKCHNICAVCPTILVLGRLRKHVLDAGHVCFLLEIVAVSPADINFIHDTQKNTLLFPPSTRRTTEQRRRPLKWARIQSRLRYGGFASVYISCTVLIKNKISLESLTVREGRLQRFCRHVEQ